MKNLASAGHTVSLARIAQKAARLAQVVNAATRTAASGAGLTNADADVLLALSGAPDHRLRPTSLSSACGLSSGGTSNVVLRLAQAGYVNREANIHDGRSTWVQLTEEGEALTRSVLDSAAAEHARLRERLPDDTAVAFEKLLDSVLDHLEGRGRRPGPTPPP